MKSLHLGDGGTPAWTSLLLERPPSSLQLYTKEKQNAIARFTKRYRYLDRNESPPREVKTPRHTHAGSTRS
ncbi:hypothetical protein CC1G_15691 [Coprinopsis cinerea okayama7|uniref:Uncharacterized protein n=1 Tax=Coprinopsis cinerea (strain Okayama-7 / 130 / ATCC MYA-4618 / FGSC 9003) TaxID=240176 RepID=D6RQF2_COPC7|nr:hypothetical protein CC1G_15691 [Coprinopsis cinerea okayama7\|eukprot:XP_002910262.1 hypothetical protein CC1G_15691 [Coprinopsis cinerea okayama7\